MSRKHEVGFISRWSSRKRSRAEERPVIDDREIESPGSQAGTAHPSQVDERSDADILQELGLPDPETLKPGDDFSAFMTGPVPSRIRNRALRKLWISNPVLANLDELLEYGEDYTDAATVVENLETAYRVGKGFLRREEVESDEDGDGQEAEPIAESVGSEAVMADEASLELPSDENIAGDPAVSDLEPDGQLTRSALLEQEPLDPDPMPPRPRRMVFTRD